MPAARQLGAKVRTPAYRPQQRADPGGVRPPPRSYARHRKAIPAKLTEMAPRSSRQQHPLRVSLREPLCSLACKGKHAPRRLTARATDQTFLRPSPCLRPGQYGCTDAGEEPLRPCLAGLFSARPRARARHCDPNPQVQFMRHRAGGHLAFRRGGRVIPLALGECS